MTTAQIERTHKALDQCCRPIHNDIWAIVFAREAMIGQIVSKLEASHPDAVEEMLSCVTLNERHPDGSVISTSGRVLWTPNPPRGLTRAAGFHALAIASAAATSIANQDAFATFSKPYCFEMPDAILAIIAAEPTGEIAGMYRGYVRHTMMPLFRRVATTFQEFSAYVELPPKDWLEKMYPDMSWRSSTNSIFIQFLYEYTVSFERILSEWSTGNFKSVRGMAQPIGAINRTLVWSQERAQAKQAELIGMTAVNEIDHSVFSRVEVATAAFEIEE